MDWATALGSPGLENGSQGGSTNFLGRVGVWSDSAGPRRFPDSTRPWNLSSERSALLDRINTFKPVPTSQHGLTVAWMPRDLSAAEYVFIRHDAHRHSLRPPYDGPFRVLEAGVKTFLVNIGGRPERVTVDRLKPAHGELCQLMVPALAPRRGRQPPTRGQTSGKNLRLLKRFNLLQTAVTARVQGDKFELQTSWCCRCWWILGGPV